MKSQSGSLVENQDEKSAHLLFASFINRIKLTA